MSDQLLDLVNPCIANYDSFGVREGTRSLSNHREAWLQAYQWKLTAFGQRPWDWGTYDLLLGSMFRGQGSYFARELAKSEQPLLRASWIEDGNALLSSLEQKRLANSRSLLYFYYASLLRLTATVDERWLEDMLQCPPTLFQCSREGHSVLRNCKKRGRCLFCLSRAASDCFRFAESQLRGATNSFHVLVSIDSMIDVGSRREDLSINESVKDRKKSQVGSLRKIANSAEASGGAIVSQLLPYYGETPRFVDDRILVPASTVSFRLRTSAVFSLSNCAAQRWMRANTVGDANSLPLPSKAFGNESFESSWDEKFRIVQTGGKNAARELIFGTYPLSDSDPINSSGHVGLFIAPEWQWLSPAELKRYFTLFKHLKLVSYFGDWRTMRRVNRSRISPLHSGSLRPRRYGGERC